MDRGLEALRKAREHVADIAELARAAEEHLEEGRFEDASARLRLIEQHAAIGREDLGPLMDPTTWLRSSRYAAYGRRRRIRAPSGRDREVLGTFR